LANSRLWRSALLYALPATVLVLALFYYWFGIADRYVVFLYYHDMGPVVPDTSPFSAVTSSRYWMAGLVAGGVVMLLYTTAAWLLGRLVMCYQPPAWWRVWTVCALPLLIGIAAITMTVNDPRLPLLNAGQTTLATLIGLGLALLPSRMAGEHPGDLIWLAAEGCGFMLILVAVAALGNLPQWLARGRTRWVWMAVTALAVAVAGLVLVPGLRLWRHTPVPTATTRFLAGLCVAYLLMPLVHHLFATDGYYYISNSSNFFAPSVPFQFVAWLIAGATATGATRLQQYLAAQGPEVHRTSRRCPSCY